MAISLSALLQNVGELHLKVGEHDLDVKYRPGKLTQGLRNKLLRGPVAFVDEAEDKSIQAAWNAYYAAFADLLLAWDVMGDDGEPLPINGETIATLPMGFVESLIEEVAKDSRVNPQIKATSASILPTKAS